MSEKIVYLLEDDKSITEVIECALEMSNIKVLSFPNVRLFKEAFENKAPSLCLLDIMLPDGNGLDVLKYIKHIDNKIVCIMLSALGSEIDKVKGLNLGADDYISKPFGTMELIARINAHLRRIGDKSYNVGGLEIGLLTHEVKLNGEKLVLNKKEFELLRYFVENPNIVISRDRLLEAVWGYEVGETRTVDNHVLRLRKMGINNIETVFGVGYKFNTGV
ncbi:MAG: response regulator transcription factor [Acholeplasmatales bacterium]|nr:response regulator transcription factor [Acholeplasmatales bacterium]